MTKRELFRAEGLPAYQNKMFDTAESASACPLGDVVLVQDERSGLVYNDAFDPAKLIYDQSYQNEQGGSVAFQQHMEIVLEKVDRHFQGGQILEVGCGKGTFLDRVRQRGYDAVGVDPACEGSVSYIHCGNFDASLNSRESGVIRTIQLHSGGQT